MSHFSSPRRSIRVGLRRLGPRLKANQINRARRNLWIFYLMVVAPPRRVGSMKDRSPKSPQTARGKFIARSHASRTSGAGSDARKKRVFSNDKHRCPSASLYLGGSSVSGRAVIGAIPSDDGGTATEKRGSRRLEPSLWGGGRLVYRRWHEDGEREGAASWQGLLAQPGDGSHIRGRRVRNPL